MELKSLYFNLVYVFLFSAKTRIYKQSKHTYTQSGAKKSLFQFCLTITEPRFLLSISRKWKIIEVSLSVLRAVSQVIMGVHKPTVAYKLPVQ